MIMKIRSFKHETFFSVGAEGAYSNYTRYGQISIVHGARAPEGLGPNALTSDCRFNFFF